jgi:hypothetical protein
MLVVAAIHVTCAKASDDTSTHAATTLALIIKVATRDTLVVVVIKNP